MYFRDKSIPQLESLVTDPKMQSDIDKLKRQIEQQTQFEKNVGRKSLQEAEDRKFPNTEIDCKPPRWACDCYSGHFNAVPVSNERRVAIFVVPASTWPHKESNFLPDCKFVFPSLSTQALASTLESIREVNFITCKP